MSWDEQQSKFGDALLEPTMIVPDFFKKTAGKPSQKRFSVYRNNVMVSLTEAINDAYPVVAQLVGEEFATAMARVYVGDNLPASPVLLDYGAGYAAFVETFEPANGLPFLADVARIEWAWLQAYHSADQQALTIEALSQINEDELADLTLTFCPCVQLLRSNYPIASIWSAHQSKDIEPELEQIVQQGECVLVNRPLWEVNVRTLTPAVYAFFSCLQAGHCLGVAIDKGQTFNDFDAALAINALFETKTVAALVKKILP